MAETALARHELCPAALLPLAEKAREYLSEAKASNTVRAYRSDWADFTTWCAAAGFEALPATPDTLVLYLTDAADRCAISTLQRRLSAISQAHQASGVDTPTRAYLVRTAWAGIRRKKGTAQRSVQAAVTEDVRRMVDTLGEDAPGVRDRALLLVGFAGAYRRSELVAHDLADAQFRREGLVMVLRRSKTDQEGEGTEKGIPYGSTPDTCPVRSLQDWLEVAEIADGAIFRPIDRHGNIRPCRLTGHSVALIVKRCAEAAGLDPDLYSGHSLRAGLVTSAAEAGVEERDIMRQTGHKSVQMVRKYIRSGSLFRANAAAKVGL